MPTILSKFIEKISSKFTKFKIALDVVIEMLLVAIVMYVHLNLYFQYNYVESYWLE